MVSTYASAQDLGDENEVANTFVPSRNALFLTIASNRAVLRGIDTVYTGVCQTDYSGYPDCRRNFIDAMERALSLSNGGNFAIVTPLMELTKAQSVNLALTVLGDSFNAVMELTHTCYQGVKGGCGECAACLLRDKGFNEAGVVDPIWKFRNSH
jgi:7-cyano-7-deazaguanine synthase